MGELINEYNPIKKIHSKLLDYQLNWEVFIKNNSYSLRTVFEILQQRHELHTSDYPPLSKEEIEKFQDLLKTIKLKIDNQLYYVFLIFS